MNTDIILYRRFFFLKNILSKQFLSSLFVLPDFFLTKSSTLTFKNKHCCAKMLVNIVVKINIEQNIYAKYFLPRVIIKFSEFI